MKTVSVDLTDAYKTTIERKLTLEIVKLRRALKAAASALNAPTHEANDYNCQDWPPGAGCRGCDGDEQRELAVKQIESVLSTTVGQEQLDRMEDAEARICELEAALVDIEKHCLSIRYIIAQVHPQYARATLDGVTKGEEESTCPA